MTEQTTPNPGTTPHQPITATPFQHDQERPFLPPFRLAQRYPYVFLVTFTVKHSSNFIFLKINEYIVEYLACELLSESCTEEFETFNLRRWKAAAS